MVTSLNTSVTAEHASLAVGALNAGVPVHSIVAFVPTPVITGGVVSCIVIVCDAVALLLHASVAVHVLVTL